MEMAGSLPPANIRETMLDKLDDLLTDLFYLWLRLIMVFAILASIILFVFLLYWGIGMLVNFIGFGIGC